MLRVNHRHPCVICGKPDWCGYTEDGTIAVCMRVESSRPCKNGGWVHILREDSTVLRPARVEHKSVLLPVPALDAEMLIAQWRQNTPANRREALATMLGVSTEALTRLDAVWAANHKAWAFPMRDASDKTVGIRLRAEDGRKWAVTGSKSGLFVPSGVATGDRLLICEGPTDTAAALTLGYDVIGRPSCRGNTETIRDWLRLHRYGEVVIIADNDQPDNKGRRPGQDGARTLAADLQCPVRMVILPVKDIRTAVQTGIPRAAVDALINDAKLQKFKPLPEGDIKL